MAKKTPNVSPPDPVDYDINTDPKRWLDASSLLKPALHSAAPEAQHEDGDAPIAEKKDNPSKADEAHGPNKEKDAAASQKPVFAQTAD